MIVERKQQRRRRREQPEEALRAAVLAYLAQSLPTTAFFCVFPHSAGALFHGLRMRDLGTREGFPNLLILNEGRAYCIDLRCGTGMLQPLQRDCIAALQDARVPVTVARSVDDVQRFLSGECALPMRTWRNAS
jgi:hypothetical protein